MDDVRYQITVEGHLDRSHWQRWFAGMDLSLQADGTTTLGGQVPDQAALHGLLEKIRDLGLVLIAVQRIDT
jgi:hypothetical protein